MNPTTTPLDFAVQADVRTARQLIKSSATVVWILLIMATVVSWSLGTLPGLEDGPAAASLLVIAFVKVRFVGLYFMDLKDAPSPLRSLFEAYCLVVCILTLSMYLAG